MNDRPSIRPPAGRHQDPDLTTEWTRPQSPVVPRPTYWPSILALSICFGLWGVVTSVWMSIVGAAGMGLAVAGWIREAQNDPHE
jgi:hypothetical protein